jgi:hypothetical protein
MNGSPRRHSCLLLLATAAVLGSVPPTLALTVDREVTPAYLREHAKEWGVKVARAQNGLLSFTISRTLPERRYLVARLLVKEKSRTLAESSSPSYARKDENRFFFSISPEHVEESVFELGESFLSGDADHPHPVPGTVNYQFRLREFVPESLRSPARAR